MLTVTTSIRKSSQETLQGQDVGPGPGAPFITQLNLSYNSVRACDILLLDLSPHHWFLAAGLLQTDSSWTLRFVPLNGDGFFPDWLNCTGLCWCDGSTQTLPREPPLLAVLTVPPRLPDWDMPTPLGRDFST